MGFRVQGLYGASKNTSEDDDKNLPAQAVTLPSVSLPVSLLPAGVGRSEMLWS